MFSISIFTPMAIKIRPPTISILFSNKCPIFLPIYTPVNDRMNVIKPIIIIGVMMGVFKMAKVTPMAKASILVATESMINSFNEKTLQTSSSE